MPFIMQLMLHIPPAIIVQRFCNVAAAISSSQLQWIFMPPAHFSIFIVQRGTMHIPICDTIAGMPGIWPIGIAPGIPIPLIIVGRSNIIVLDIAELPWQRTGRGTASQRCVQA